LKRGFFPKQKRPNTVQPLGEISDPAKSQGRDGATPIRGGRVQFIVVLASSSSLGLSSSWLSSLLLV
jgi:hypothetical protein